MTLMKHKHHHPPQHRVGKHNNTIEVSVEEHAELHLYEYLCHGEWEDWVAYHALSGQITMSEASKEAMRRGASNANKNRTTESRREAARKANTPEVRKQKSETMKLRHAEKSDWYDFSPEHRARVAENTRRAQAKMREEGKRIGRKPKAVLFDGVLYQNIKEMSIALELNIKSCYKKIYSGEARYQ